MAERIGFIGLGLMGSRMAANLQSRGHHLVVYNRSREKADALIRGGATWAATPAIAATDVDVLVTILSEPSVVTEMGNGPDGFIDAMRPGSIWINSTTVNPSFARQMAAQAAAGGIRYLDAPVAGSREAAANGQLVFLVGGAEEDLDVCRPLLDAMGQRIVHVGEAGLGSALKMVNNLLAAGAITIFAEGVALGQGLGISREALFDTLVGGRMVAPFVAEKLPKMAGHDYDTEFKLRLMQKDLHLATVSGYEAGVAIPTVNTIKELYRLAMRDGYGDQDMSAIYAFLNDASRSSPE